MTSVDRRKSKSPDEDVEMSNRKSSTLVSHPNQIHHTQKQNPISDMDEEDYDDYPAQQLQSPTSTITFYYRHYLYFATLSMVSVIILCPLVAIYLHFEESTFTHCRVYNFLPSFSASIGNSFPETSIWNIGICFMQGQRVIDAIATYIFNIKTAPNTYTMVSDKSNADNAPTPTPTPTSTSTPSSLQNSAIPFHVRNYYILNRLRTLCFTFENLSLILLTYVSSTHSGTVHQLGFLGFLLFSLSNMFLYLTLFNAKQYFQPLSSELQKSYRIKKISAASFIFFAFTAIYTYLRHQDYCEPYVYSFFALSEYLLIFSNVIFHFTAAIDVYDLSITFEL